MNERAAFWLRAVDSIIEAGPKFQGSQVLCFLELEAENGSMLIVWDGVVATARWE